MQTLIGIFFHFIGGAASGSFYIPFKKVRGWAWESYWIVGGLFSWLIVPPLAAWLTVPHFTEIIRQASPAAFGWTFFWGLLWGVGGLLYGLGVRYLGMSLGQFGVAGVYIRVRGAGAFYLLQFVPTPGKTSFHELLSSNWGRIVLAGVALCLAGIYICGRAGVLKERELPEEKKKESVEEFHLVKGLDHLYGFGYPQRLFQLWDRGGQLDGGGGQSALATRRIRMSAQSSSIRIMLPISFCSGAGLPPTSSGVWS